MDFIQTVGARLFPALESVPAKVACPRRHPVGVEAGGLVEGDVEGGVGGAKDMPTVAAVMPAKKDPKGGAAGWGVAVG